VAYAERLRAHGVAVEIDELGDMVHGFLLMTGACPAAGAATQRLAERIGAELRSDGG
jgi:acetyl esterase/lipase